MIIYTWMQNFKFISQMDLELWGIISQQRFIWNVLTSFDVSYHFKNYFPFLLEHTVSPTIIGDISPTMEAITVFFILPQAHAECVHRFPLLLCIYIACQRLFRRHFKTWFALTQMVIILFCIIYYRVTFFLSQNYFAVILCFGIHF